MKQIEEFMKQMGLPFTNVGDNTWAAQPSTNIVTRIGIRLEGDVLTFSTPVAENKEDAALYAAMLRFNATDLLHAAYGIEGDKIVLSGALAAENLDFNEFQAMIDDISLGIDTHFAAIRKAA